MYTKLDQFSFWVGDTMLLMNDTISEYTHTLIASIL